MDTTVAIPIVIICFNNYKFVKNMIQQLERILVTPNILIINNHSTCKYTNDYLRTCNRLVFHCNRNEGHLVWKKAAIYDTLPDRFILTDPDLEFHPNTPSNFIDVLLKVSKRHKANKVGFALDISEPEKMFPYRFCDFGYAGITTICESQQQYWQHRIPDAELEMYEAPIDTTFCLFDKHQQGPDIRLAGNFTMKHLPWYLEMEGISRLARYLMYKDASSVSSIKGFELKYLADRRYLPIQKRNETLLIQMDGGINDAFWRDIYPTWENETFDVFDRYLQRDKQFLDIGAWVGTTAIYASRQSSLVVCVESDPVSVKKLQHNIDTNRLDCPILVEPSAIYHESTTVVFGTNRFLGNSQLNDSTSQIKASKTSESDIVTPTITLQEIIQKYDLTNLSLIKVDIEGGEENILQELLAYSRTNGVPVYLSFHYDWWKDKNLDRFTELTPAHKDTIRREPFGSILFHR